MEVMTIEFGLTVLLSTTLLVINNSCILATDESSMHVLGMSETDIIQEMRDVEKMEEVEIAIQDSRGVDEDEKKMNDSHE